MVIEAFQERPHTKSHRSENTEKASQNLPALKVYKMPSPLKT